jgi:hypothetical protein
MMANIDALSAQHRPLANVISMWAGWELALLCARLPIVSWVADVKTVVRGTVPSYGP